MNDNQGFVEREVRTAIEIGISPDQLDEFLHNNPNLKQFSITKTYKPHNLMIEEDDEGDWW